MEHIASLAEVEGALDTLIERNVRRLRRRPGQKEDRCDQLFGEKGKSAPAGALAPALMAEESTLVEPPEVLSGAQLAYERTAAEHAAAGIAADESGEDDDLAARVRALEADIEALREEFAALRRG